jgi:septal ring-binding cell division protein DamX
VSAGPPAPTGRDGEQLYLERLRASAKWLAGTYRNSYTVQLMMLASEQAVPNVKKMLVQDEYFALKDNFYILRKKTSPPTLFVFYGAYDSMEQARQARNNMPLFLRKHHPYALSISDAVKKTED